MADFVPKLRMHLRLTLLGELCIVLTEGLLQLCKVCLHSVAAAYRREIRLS